MASMAAEPRLILPPADFATRDLPIETVGSGTTLVRIHRAGLGAIHFGRSGDNRFDDPEDRYGTCYTACTLEGAFAETCLRAVGSTLVSLEHLATRAITLLTMASGLRLVRMHGSGLARLGATAAVTSGSYDGSQPWSRAIHEHPAAPDGIVYRSNHDNGELCVVLFERCRERLVAGPAEALTGDRARLAVLLDRYKVGLG
jgi:hypothetical protein